MFLQISRPLLQSLACSSLNKSLPQFSTQYNISCNNIKQYVSKQAKYCNTFRGNGQPHITKQRFSIAGVCVRQFHTSGKRNAFPPLVWVVVSFVGKVGAALTGRRWRQWLWSQPKDIQKKYCRRMLVRLGILFSFGSCAGSMYYYNHLQKAPVTGRRRFITLTREQYLKVAEFESENFNEEFKNDMLPATDLQYAMVLDVARQIVRSNKDFPGMEQTEWRIHVVKKDDKNAFVLPNGHIFVFTGLLDFMENKDQLAIVLGHEMSHALLLHAAEQISYSQFLDYFVIGTMAAIWILMPNDGIAIVTNWFYNKVMHLSIHMPYSRTLEKEADRVGLVLAGKACFDVREGPVFWNRMSIAADMQGEKVPEWMCTHPSHDNRIKTLNELIPKMVTLRDECNCPRLPLIDPRQRASQLRTVVDNIMIAKATKANLERVQTVTRKSS